MERICASRPAFQEILNEVFQHERKWPRQHFEFACKNKEHKSTGNYVIIKKQVKCIFILLSFLNWFESNIENNKHIIVLWGLNHRKMSHLTITAQGGWREHICIVVKNCHQMVTWIQGNKGREAAVVNKVNITNSVNIFALISFLSFFKRHKLESNNYNNAS